MGFQSVRGVCGMDTALGLQAEFSKHRGRGCRQGAGGEAVPLPLTLLPHGHDPRGHPVLIGGLTLGCTPADTEAGQPQETRPPSLRGLHHQRPWQVRAAP